MSRQMRWIVALVMLAVLAVVGFWGRSDGHAAQPVESGQVASLKDQLEKGLRARRPIEFQFVAQVAQLVDAGQLSLPLVQGTFSWTRKKYPDRRYLVPLFEQALRQRAAKEGITVLNNVPTTFPNLQ